MIVFGVIGIRRRLRDNSPFAPQSTDLGQENSFPGFMLN